MKTSVLITTFNRSELLKHSLNRMKRLTLPDEILIVDDGSSDGTEQIVKTVQGDLPIRYIYNHNPEWSICSFARNIGIKNTDADIVITSEPEMLWVTDVVKQIKDQMEANPEHIVSAGVIYSAQQDCRVGESYYEHPELALKSAIVQDYETRPRSYHPGGFCKMVNHQATYICGYRRDWLIELGGWDERFPGCWGVDDIDLCTRLRINGHNQIIDQSIESIHQHHGKPPAELWMKAQSLNWRHFESKNLNSVTKGDPILTANTGIEWGVLR